GGGGGRGEGGGGGGEAVGRGERVHGVAARLGHLAAGRVADQAVQEDVAERHGVGRVVVAHRVQAEHHHPGDPEEQDVVAGDQDRRRVEAAQVVGVLGPAQGGERPQRGGEPRGEERGGL